MSRGGEALAPAERNAVISGILGEIISKKLSSSIVYGIDILSPEGTPRTITGTRISGFDTVSCKLATDSPAITLEYKGYIMRPFLLYFPVLL